MDETIHWHKAADVLPDYDKSALIIEAGEVEVRIAYLGSGNWYDSDGFRIDTDVLFWAALPEGPKQ